MIDFFLRKLAWGKAYFITPWENFKDILDILVLRQVKTTSAPQPCIHPAVKPHLGKAPVQTASTAVPENQQINEQPVKVKREPLAEEGNKQPSIVKKEVMGKNSKNSLSEVTPSDYFLINVYTYW